MKQIKTIILTMLAALLALPVSARDFEYDGLTYTVIDEDLRTCQTKEGTYGFEDQKYVPGNNVSGELEIPGTVSDGSNTYSVVKIGAYSFARSGLTSIVFPATVTTIGAGAFIDCFDLATVQLTESVSILEPYAFGWCTGLNEINLPSTLTYIPAGAFFKSAYRSMKLPESLVSIGAYAFGYSAISLEELPPHLETIGDFAFCSTDGISKIVFPESLVSIGVGAFSDGTEYASYCYLSTAVIPASVQSIGAFAFNNLWSDFDVQYDAVTPVSFSESLFNEEVYSRSTLNVPNAALADVLAVTPWNRFSRINAKDGSIAPPEATDRNFEYEGIVYTVLDEEAKTCKIRDQWYDVEEENIPDTMFEGDFVVPSVVSDGTNNYTVVEIGWQSFSFCSKVTSVILPETIKKISQSAFSSSSLTSIKLPESLTWIGKQAFSESDLSSVTIPESVTYIGPGVFGSCKKLESVVLPPTLTVIGSDAFYYCEGLKTIDLPSSLVALGIGAFRNCWNLEIKEWPESLQSIGVRAMDGKFGDLILPKNLRVIDEQAFWQVDMSSLTLPASLEFIGRYAFDRNKLKEITYNASNPITALADIFYVDAVLGSQYNAYTDARLNMPNATLTAAESALPWGLFDRIYASDEVKDPGMMAGKDFEYDGLVYTVIDPEAKTCKTKAGDWYYGYTPGNTASGDVVIPEKAQFGINEYTVVEIPKYAFVEQEEITSISIPETVKLIDYNAFSYCKGLKSVVVPESVDSIGHSAFSDCDALTSVTLPASLRALGTNIFDYCESITSVTYNAENPVGSNWDMFEPNIYEDATLYMPNATLETVQSVEPWMDFKKIQAKDGSIGIGITETVVCLANDVNYEIVGFPFTEEKIEVAGGTSIVSSKAGSFGIAYTDLWHLASTYATYGNVKVGDSEEIILGRGVAGSTNPTFESYQAGAPSAGAVFEIEAKADGWMTVFTKINPNKQYVVFEGQSNPVAYTLGVGGPDYQICYTLPSLESGYIDLNASDASRYFIGDSKPQFPYLVAELESAPKEQTGFMTFKVKEGAKYYVSALGSKMACQGFVYTPGETEPDVTFCATEELPEIKFKGGSTPSVTPPEEPSLGDPIVSGSSTIVFATQEDLEMAGIESAKTEISGGTMILNTNVGSFSLAYDDEWGTATTYDLYRNVKVGDSEEFTLGLGAAGNSNPTFVSYQEGVMSAGAVFKMKAKKDGWMTVFSRMNPNKQYIVFEGESGALSYTLGMAGEDYKINYTLPCYTSGENAGMIDFSAADADKYFIESLPGQNQPQFPWVVAGLESAPGLGTGFMTFRVKAGKDYYVSGLGSKMSCQGFVLTESENAPNVTFYATDELPEIKFITTLGYEPLKAGDDFEYQGIWYTVIDAEAMTVKTKEGGYDSETEIYYGANNVVGELSIPPVVSDGYNNFTVVEIGMLSFKDCKELTSLTLPNTVKYTRWMSFADCTSLESVSLPNSLEKIETFSFASCTSLKEIVIPEGVTEIGSGAFDSCRALVNVDFPETLTVIGTNAFIVCRSLESIDLPSSLLRLESAAFDGCSLNSVVLPENLEYLGDIVFLGNPLVSVTIPASLQEAEETPFKGCVDIKEVSYLAETPVALVETLFDETVYSNAALNTPNATLAAVQATVPWSLFKKVVASDGEFGFGEPVEAGEVFEFEGIFYSVLNPDDKVCSVVRADIDENFIEIREEVPYKDYLFAVVGIGDQAFSGKNLVETVSLPSSIAMIGSGVFEDCGRLTSLIWRGSNAMPYDLMESIDNPNLIVYVDEERFAPSGLDRNVVAYGVCDNLVLVPGYPFAPYDGFTAKNSSMTKEFTQQTAYDGCAGWETIVLPFTVTKVTSAEGHALLPFNKVTDVNRQRPFWLYEADPAGEWAAADSIKGGIPYLIAMPNNPRYNPAYNVSGAVTFSNPNPQTITTSVTTPVAVTWASGSQFHSLWMPLSDEQSMSALGLNVNATVMVDGKEYAPGSAFLTGITPKPLEAYVTSGNARAFPIRGMQSAVLELQEADGLTIAQEGRVLMLKSGMDRMVDIHSADGTLLRRVDLRAGEPAYVEGLPQGVCLVAGRKVMIH